ncbi:MAG TPA: M48 family metalloprotease [Chryseolinea sp.]
MATVIYPATPKNVDDRILQPTRAFKQEVTKVLGSILFFMVTYIALMAAAIVLAVLCCYGGVMIVTLWPRFITLMLGVGLIGLGLMVIYFLLKFLFKSKTTDRSGLTEITAADQPELFQFIKTLTRETQSMSPKRIYVSPEVNAYVFYDSSFWSMFFPVRKNLTIGLALVNSVNLSEFKAILAHEFGHFSQRSMKLGSYVYNVNQVIYNMLYDNDDYGEVLAGWANASGYFAIFAGLTAGIVRGIQWILKEVYTVMNKSYMSLSRQMEFHADAVAAYVSGSDHLITSLRKLEVANTCYDKVFQVYGAWFEQEVKPVNVYPDHAEVMRHFAADHGLALENGLPKIEAESMARFNKSRVVVKDQWASHPSTDDREAHLRSLNTFTETEHASAWVIFRDAEALQKKITEKVYANVTFKEAPLVVDSNIFSKRYYQELEKYTLNKRYKGFFTYRSIADVDVDALQTTLQASNLDEVLDEPTLELPFEIAGIKNDINTLDIIRRSGNRVKTFEFEGEKLDQEDAGSLAEKLKTELTETEVRLAEADKKVITFFIQQAVSKGVAEKIKDDYRALFAAARQSKEDLMRYIEIQTTMQPLYYQQVTIEKAHALMNLVRQKEKPIKERLKTMLANEHYGVHYTSKDKEKLEQFIVSDHTYFKGSSFLDAEMALLHDAMKLYQTLATDYAFILKKELLERQLQLLD